MKKNFLTLPLVIIISALAGFLIAGLYHQSVSLAQGNLWDNFLNFLLPTATSSKITAPNPVSYQPPIDYEEAVIKTVETNAPAVISIIVSKDLPIIENCPVDPFGNLPPEFQQFFGPDFKFQQPCANSKGATQKQEIGGGSGFIVAPNGLILTNKHVVADTAASYTVLTNDGKRYDAKVLARDPVQDLAIVKIQADGLPTVKLGDSDSIRLGQSTVAIGNALGEFRNTVSSGIVSGLSRAIDAGGGATTERLDGLIQTDAAINPGNSGGPLLNLRGEVIGIDTAIAEGAQNIGFAIPINAAKRDIESVKQTGTISVPFLGVRYILINQDLVDQEKLSVDHGALVRGNQDGPAVVPNSPAAKAGLQTADIILELNGEKISLDKSLASLIQKYKVGDTIQLKVLRAGKELKLAVTLGERK